MVAKRAKYEASFNAIYNRYRRNAHSRGTTFDLSKEEFREIAEKNCIYCGASPNNDNSWHHNYNGMWLYTGIDRIDNTKGYILDNVQPCCSICNKLKSNLSEMEFLRHISLVVSRLWRERFKDEELSLFTDEA